MKPIFITICVVFGLAVASYGDQNDNNKHKGKGQPAGQGQQQQQQQHQANKQTRHLGNQEQHTVHQENKLNRHVGNQDQHALHQENKLDRHVENQDQHAVHQENKLTRHEENQGQHAIHQENKLARHEARHFDFQGHPHVEAVRFHNQFRISGAERWQGANYAAFRNYRAVWHDRAWWAGHHSRIVFVYGAPYYWNAGWWYPAWGYEPSATYYYDGPIYAYNDLPPDQVVANVQTTLQEQGLYQGEVDGVLGPLTRAAIASYQESNGLTVTSAIDQPTLESLGMS